MARHAALRAVALPAAPKHLLQHVTRLCEHCPALREINAESFDVHAATYSPAGEEDDDDEDGGAYFGFKPGADLVARCARVAARRGVTRFLCTSFFAEGDSEGEYGSDGGSVGEYCGDGNVLKYIQ